MNEGSLKEVGRVVGGVPVLQPTLLQTSPNEMSDNGEGAGPSVTVGQSEQIIEALPNPYAAISPGDDLAAPAIGASPTPTVLGLTAGP